MPLSVSNPTVHFSSGDTFTITGPTSAGETCRLIFADAYETTGPYALLGWAARDAAIAWWNAQPPTSLTSIVQDQYGRWGVEPSSPGHPDNASLTSWLIALGLAIPQVHDGVYYVGSQRLDGARGTDYLTFA